MTRASNKPIPLSIRAIAILPAVMIGLVFAATTMGQEADPPGDGGQRSAVQTADGQPDIHPEAVSSLISRTYQIRPKKLWTELLRLLEESGYPPEEVDEKERVVKTSFVDFESKDFSEEVGEPQPRLSADYRILQQRRVRAGKLSLEARVTQGDRGAKLLIRARILVDGLDQENRIRALTDRRSSGVIEADFLRLLEDNLKLERL